MIALKYNRCDDHPGIRGSLNCEECVEAMREGQASLRAMIEDPDDRDEFSDSTLNAVLAELGWRTERSVIPGRKRVFDEACFLNVWSELETWAELERRGFARKAQT